jgi:hypothetical protein
MRKVKFKVVKGKWNIGNLNDKLVSASFDFFMNLKRELPKPIPVRVRRNLREHNYEFVEPSKRMF